MTHRTIPITWIGLLLCPFLLVACSQDKAAGPVSVQLIHPVPGHCAYSLGATNVDTLTNITTQISGLMGQVVTSSGVFSDQDAQSSSPSSLDNPSLFSPLTVNFINGGGVYAPEDIDSLFGISLYYAIEKGYELFAGLDPNADITKLTNMPQTLIVDEGQRVSDPGTAVEGDNAEYLPHTITLPSGQTMTKNFFFSYPTQQVTQIPLGLNLGIMVHEFTHMEFQWLFYQPGAAAGVQIGSNDVATPDTLSSVNEGMADFFGYMATQDPGFFLCSFPTENRDLSVPKVFDDNLVQSIQTGNNFDPHAGGAVFAAMNYQVVLALGNPTPVAQAIIRFMYTLLNCSAAVSGNTISLDFGKVAACEIQAADPNTGSVMRQVFPQYLGAYAGEVQ